MLSSQRPEPRNERRGALIAGVVVVAAVAGALVVLRPGEAAPDAAPSAAPPTLAPVPQAFQLSITTDPAGATVSEGERELGATPLTLPITPGSVADGPRRFVVKKAGFDAHTLLQGASKTDVSVHATLSPAAPEPAPAASASAVATTPPLAVTAPPPAVAPRAPRPAVRPPPPAPPARPAAPDIRLER